MPLDDATRELFREEVHENLAELESALLELEDEPTNRENVDRVFRALHTVKGVGAMFGHDDIAMFAHEVEGTFARVREGRLAVSHELLDLTLAARDHLLSLFDERAEADPARGEEIVARLRVLCGATDDSCPGDDAPPPQEAPCPEICGETFSYRIRFRPDEGLFASGVDPLGLMADLAELGECVVVARTGRIPPLSELDPELCLLGWDVVLTTDRGEDAIRDVFIFADGLGELTIEVLEAVHADGDDEVQPRLGDILVERGDISEDDLRSALGEHRRLGELLTDSGRVSDDQLRSALAEQEAVRSVKSRRRQEADSSSIRVSADKLDDLVSLVGELAIVQAQITQAATDGSRHHLARLSEELERLSSRLRERTLSVRMLPIGHMFSRFRRLVHDLSNELDKHIELETFGAETEVDKTVFERMGDPLVHLIRNCADHGIESPEVRASAGKPEAGRIRLGAAHAGGEVRIIVEDDGRGMDSSRILARAREMGIVGAEAEVKSADVLSLIFEPGFSTMNEVTNLSGRGVGMDVVRRGIDSLRGSVEVESTPGGGTRFTLRIPLTLAIIEGLQVQVGGEFYVIPLASVQECLEFSPRQAQVLDIRGQIIPWVRLREVFGLDGTRPSVEQIVVAGVENRRMGIVVDRVVGEHQTVIRSLGRLYRDVRAFSGATVRVDGSMALILDVQGLMRTLRPEVGMGG
ncbi:two-component system chemotaxis sensor kinase CheA [Desulfobaculum xiamenense]|uniref:Chemotaxis protein CheA n=1 Tax=Desulfobaculum xiamenense TaxID=995050 RepID=A0A846QHK9_9BACT|nr:chemotaxis protein CheA [Desulfobaculum xiamenense]NJB66600.1 two-component system chemotaxis sensor kinase CheA [Desulfobaculum xiamenense]